MSEIQRHFLQGKMNLDLDERIIPNGQYIDALNIFVSTSEGSDVGAIENSLGNEQKTFLNLTDATCIGAYGDDSNQKIYYFVTAQEKDLILEYDDVQEAAIVILESTRINGKTLLNFKKENLITGVVKILSGTGNEDLLGWTDDNEQPRIINIERAKAFGADNFNEDDISLIKRPPIFAPQTKFTYAAEIEESTLNNKFLSFAIAYRFVDGYISALSPFTLPAFAPSKFKLDPQTLENVGMQNAFSAIDVVFDTGMPQVTDVLLVFKETNSETVYVVDEFNKANLFWGDNEQRSYKFSNNKIYRVLPETEIHRTYDSVPRKAKAMAVAGNRIALGNYLEGYDLTDKFGEKVRMDYNLSLFTKNLQGRSLEATYSTINVENDIITLDFSDAELKKNTRISFDLQMVEKVNGTGTYNGSFDFILNKDFADCVKLSVDTEFVQFIQSVLTDDFIANYTTTPPANSTVTGNSKFVVSSATAKTINIQAPSVSYQIDNTPADTNDSDFTSQINYWGYLPQTSAYFKETAIDSTCKTNRSYEVAQIYLDEYGRSTPCLTSFDNTLYIPQKYSIFQNKIRVNVNHRPPSWAKYFRFAIKQNRTVYQTIYATIFYEDGLFRWIKLEGSNKDKVKEGDTLIVKSDLSGVADELVKVRVLEIKSQDANFISGNLDVNGEEINEEAGLYMKVKSSGFDMNYNGDTFKNYEDYAKSDKRANIFLGAFGEKNADGIYSDYKINAGTVVDFWIKSYGRGDEKIYEKQFIATESYDNFQLFFEAEVKNFDNKVNEFEFYRGTGFSLFKNNELGHLYLRVQSYEHGTFIDKTKIRGTLNLRFTEGTVVFETEPEDALSDVFYETSQTFEIVDGEYHKGNIQDQDSELASIVELDFYNAYALGNGVESYRYKDGFNTRYLNIDTRPMLKSVSEYRAIRRYADITFGDAYVESLGINGLNNFNASTANYKDDVVKKYGSIQKMIGRDTDLLVWQEDKTSRVLYGKELILSPDGSSNLSTVDSVLGSQVFYAGEHGISRNPESVAQDGNRIWFTDEKRGDVNRLSMDGITKISQYGLSTWFRNRFADTMNRAKVGCFDPHNEKYVLATQGGIIYNPAIKFDCSGSIKKENFAGTYYAEVDFGLSLGDAGISYTTNGKPVKIKLEWDGNIFDTGWIGNSIYAAELLTATGYVLNGSVTTPILFDKNKLMPRKAYLTIEAPLAGTTFEVSGNCVVLDEFTVISIITSHVSDANKILDNRYKWVFGNYTSPYKHFQIPFAKEGGISLFNKETGKEGIGYIPMDASKIIMESFKGYGDTGSFGDDDALSYLISNTEYAQTDIDTIKSLVTKVPSEMIMTAGGEIINRMSFNLDRPNAEQFLYLLWDYSSLSINIDTHIYIYFDSSGSMNSSLAPLQTMRDTILKDALLPLYEYDEAAYNEKVKVISNGSERTLQMLNMFGATPAGNVIVLVFQDEAENQGTYHGTAAWTINSPRSTPYDSELLTLRNRLNSFAANYYRAVVFQVDGNAQFPQWLDAVQHGKGQYAGTNGLSDRNEFAYQYNVPDGDTPENYKTIIVNTLKGMGFNL
jgi:hypothetical protein